MKIKKNDQVLVIGQYLSQLDMLAKVLKAPLITGKTPNAERSKLYDAFREGKMDRVLEFVQRVPIPIVPAQAAESAPIYCPHPIRCPE